jgi:hypothetical protein
MAKMVSYTNKQVQMLLTDLLLGTIRELGDFTEAHEWICPLFTAATPYSPFYHPINHMLNALELLDGDADENDASERDKALATRIETMLEQNEMRQRAEALKSSPTA